MGQKLNSQKVDGLRGEAKIQTDGSKGSKTYETKKTQVLRSTTPRWDETMEWKVVNFDTVSPKLQFWLKEGKDGKFMFMEFTSVDLKQVKDSGQQGVWLDEGKEYSIRNRTSGLGQNPKVRIRVEFF